MSLWPVFIFIFLGLSIGLGMLFISKLLGAKQTTTRKMDIYESGVNPVGSATRRYSIKFYLTAVLFLLFDVEVIFLVPWALNFSQVENRPLLLAELAFFLFILLGAYLFVVLSKSLDWEE